MSTQLQKSATIHQLKLVPAIKLQAVEPEHNTETEAADTILDESLGILKTCLVIGKTPDGSNRAVATTASKAELLYMLKEFETDLINGVYDGE